MFMVVHLVERTAGTVRNHRNWPEPSGIEDPMAATRAVVLLSLAASASAFIARSPSSPLRNGWRSATPLMQDDLKNAFAARLKQQKQDDRKAERGKLKGAP